MRLPQALQGVEDEVALGYLEKYYRAIDRSKDRYTGAEFDAWDSTGTRAVNADRFTADDLISITFLSVQARAEAAIQILRDENGVLAGLLIELGADHDLVDVEDPLPSDFAGWRLWSELQKLDNIGPTTASKLIARKRPRLRPIYDSVIGEVTKSTKGLWEPLRVALRMHDKTLHRRLLELKEAAQLPAEVSALRVFDVIAWMEGQSPKWAKTP